MKNLFLVLFIIAFSNSFAQTHSRKTRSDKGGKHKHSTTYIVKKALKPKTTSTKKKK